MTMPASEGLSRKQQKQVANLRNELGHHGITTRDQAYRYADRPDNRKRRRHIEALIPIMFPAANHAAN